MSNRLYVVTMPDGSRWGIPAEKIAENRAAYYAKGDPDLSEEDAYKAEYEVMMEWFDSDDFEFADWAKNNMNWSDVKEFAVQLPRAPMPVDWEEGWMNGDYEYMTVKDESNG